MTTIYLIRSGEAEGDLYRIAHGHTDTALTNRGHRQLEALAARFVDLPLDAVYTSDLARAHATAEAICRPKGLAACLRADLRELTLGQWEGEHWGNIAYDQAEQLGLFKALSGRWQVDGAEPWERALGRIVGAIRRIAADHPDGAVAVVSHGFIIRSLLGELSGVPADQLPDLIGENNTAVSVIEVTGDALRLVELSDVGHLPEGALPSAEKPDFETDMYLYPLPWLEYGEAMAQAVSSVWQESGEMGPFDKARLLEDAGMLTTIVGFVGHEPAGFLQLGREPGWITLICTHPGCRRAGLGAQLIGWAVTATRAAGGDRLSIALPKGNPHRPFFVSCGFVPAGQTPEHREIMEKTI